MDTSEIADLSIGIPIPERIMGVVEGALTQYPEYIERQVPTDQWHLTLLWLGHVENPKQYYSRLRPPLAQSYVPTVQLTHVGRGKPTRQELWAFAEPTSVLLGLREQLIQRLRRLRFQFPEGYPRRDYAPHITVAHLYPVVGQLGLADTTAVSSFTLNRVHVYKRLPTPTGPRYEIVETTLLG